VVAAKRGWGDLVEGPRSISWSNATLDQAAWPQGDSASSALPQNRRLPCGVAHSTDGLLGAGSPADELHSYATEIAIN
jgi:hypothetical protein